MRPTLRFREVQRPLHKKSYRAQARVFWASAIVLARYVAGHIPPVALSFTRWAGALLILLPMAWPHLRRDWPTLMARLPLMLMLSATGFAINYVLTFWALQYTEALNGLLVQSAGPLFVAFWALALFGVRPTGGQFVGIAISLAGVTTIILHGDIATLMRIHFNIGDLMYAGGVLSFGLYSALMLKCPEVHPLSLITFTAGGGAVLLLPFVAWESASGATLTFDTLTVATLVYIVIFPSVLAYLFFNRGIALVGPNRSAPFQHLVPVFGSVMAILFLDEQPHLFHLLGYALVLSGVMIASRQPAARISK
ncbi:MAG: DMT family transporter [Xanthobacteraceae bacterium]